MCADFNRILADLSRPEAYPHVVSEVRVVQTHISAVFLVGDFAYKVKKPVDFGFLDYSTFERRERFCREELRLNRRLSPDVYLGLSGIVEGTDGRLRIATPSPDPSQPLEWAVKMRRLLESDMLPVQLAQGRVNEEVIRRIARRIASFHAEAAVDDESRRFGAPEQVEETVAGNLRHAEEAAGPLLPTAVYERLRSYIARFVAEQRELLGKRAATGKVRRCHGDLRLQNICLDPDLGDGIQIFDCIEFNARYQCVDVIADLAYLAMDLDLAGRADLRWALVDEYERRASELEIAVVKTPLRSGVRKAHAPPPSRLSDLRVLLPFYQCYRACVRGKIGMLAAAEEEIPEAKRREEAEIACAAFELAQSYAAGKTQPTLIAMHGYSGSGKSTIATRLARTEPAAPISSDVVRKELAGVGARSKIPVVGYARERRARVYEALLERASDWLSSRGIGHS